MENKITKRQRTRMLLMHHAKVLFEEKGLDNVTFDDIAQSAQVCRTTVFNHFSNISQLMTALIDSEMEDLTSLFCQRDLQGRELIFELFDKLSEDICSYPVLMTKLTNNSVLKGTSSKAVSSLEKLVEKNIQLIEPRPVILQSLNVQELASLIMSVYYGTVNHIHVNGLDFNPSYMSLQIHKAIEYLLKGE